MAKACTVIDIGWRNEWKEEKVYTEINKLMNDYMLRAKMSKSGQESVDGKGNSRCAQLISDLYNAKA